MKINRNYLNLKDDYLFATVSKKVHCFQEDNPDKDIILLGIGDVTKPLCPTVVEALHSAVEEMGTPEGFHGYGPYRGYDFLVEAVRDYYANRGVKLDSNEIFISDGAKSDAGNILDIFAGDNKVLIPDPVYPVYVDTNIMDGRDVEFIDANISNKFLPLPDYDVDADIIYLCSPNNPTGAVYNKAQLKKWVDYAISKDALILFDSAYEAFISEGDLPHSIFEIEGAEKCAIEICSLSKTAGFTGTRCSYTVIPMGLKFEGVSLNKLWFRRQTTKYNGVPYIIQRGAQAVFTNEGQRQIHATLSYYKKNAHILAKTLDELHIFYTGGTNSPYVWFKCPNDMDSWDFFDLLLKQEGVVGTPGAGFGANGDNFFRLTAFSTYENTLEAAKRIRSCIENLGSL